MHKTLLEKASPKVWDALLREVTLYPSTTLKVFESLKSHKFISYLTFNDVNWIAREVLQKQTFSFGDIYDLFYKDEKIIP
jgi:hypothetical protein